MKKLLFVGLVAFMGLFSLNTQAQSLDLGVKVGANFANISDASNLDSKTGLLAGAFVAVNFDHWGLQPELLYSQQGAKTDLGDFDLDYITVPVMFKYYLIGNVLNLQVGPQFGFVVNDNAPSVGDQLKTKDFDMSGAVGAGLELPLGFQLTARYHFGLTDVANNLGKNNVFSVALGYSFL